MRFKSHFFVRKRNVCLVSSRFTATVPKVKRPKQKNAAPFSTPEGYGGSWFHVKDERCRLVSLVPNAGRSLNSPPSFPSPGLPPPPVGRFSPSLHSQTTSSPLPETCDGGKVAEWIAPWVTPRWIVGISARSPTEFTVSAAASLRRLQRLRCHQMFTESNKYLVQEKFVLHFSETGATFTHAHMTDVSVRPCWRYSAVFELHSISDIAAAAAAAGKIPDHHHGARVGGEDGWWCWWRWGGGGGGLHKL